MNNGLDLSQGRAFLQATHPGVTDRLFKKQMIDRLKALSPSLVASGAIVNARRSTLDAEPPSRRGGRSPRK